MYLQGGSDVARPPADPPTRRKPGPIGTRGQAVVRIRKFRWLGGEPQPVPAAARADRLDAVRAGNLRQKRRHRILAGVTMPRRSHQAEPVPVVDRLASTKLVPEDLDRDLPEPLPAQLFGLQVDAKLWR